MFYLWSFNFLVMNRSIGMFPWIPQTYTNGCMMYILCIDGLRNLSRASYLLISRCFKNIGLGGAVTCLGDLGAEWPHLSGD
jgi:hypothetical protein